MNLRQRGYLGEANGGAKVPLAMKRKIQVKLNRAGLDGNGRFGKAEEGYSKALDVLSDFGIELGEVVSSYRFSRINKEGKGNLAIEIAWTNKDDPFSPEQITKNRLALGFTELRKNYWETVAYIS